MSGNKGHFQPGNAAHKRRGKAKAKGIAAEVRKHKKVIVAGLLELATKGTATAKARALSELARIGWGSPASAAEMGAIDRIDAAQPFADAGNSIAAWHDRRDRTDAGDLLSVLTRMAQRSAEPVASYTAPALRQEAHDDDEDDEQAEAAPPVPTPPESTEAQSAPFDLDALKRELDAQEWGDLTPLQIARRQAFGE